MGSSAQNSSGVDWCRRQVRFNEVPEKAPKVPEKVWEALVQSQVRLNRVPVKVPVKVWDALVQSQQGSGENCGKGGFGNLWCRAGSGSIGSAEGFQRLASQHASERLVKIRRRGCWGYHRSLLETSATALCGTTGTCRSKVRIIAVHWFSSLPD